MSKKFFSLINKTAIHVAPKRKILPKEQIQKLLNGDELLEEIKKDAEKYREEVTFEGEKLKEAAQKQGYEEGFKSWLEQIAKLEQEIINVRNEFQKALLPIALKAAKKIVGREIELAPEVIIDIVANSLKAVATHKKITIYVSKKDFEILEIAKPKLKSIFEVLESFTLRARADINPGGCIIETEWGIINAQLDNQWRTLERAFDHLGKQKAGLSQL